MSWWETPSMGTPPAPHVYEPEREQRPVLYDAKGKPLAYERKTIGFKPPKEERNER